MQEILDQLVKNVREDIPGYIAISVAEMASGESLHSHSSKPDFDPALACAYNVEIVNSKRKAMKTIGLDEKIKDIYFNLENEIHIINLSPSGEYFIYLAVDSKKSKLSSYQNIIK